MSSKPVWIWLPGRTDPVQAGTLTLRLGPRQVTGQYVYAPAYVDLDAVIPLDQGELANFRHVAPTTEYGGLYGVMQDAMPDGFGLHMLYRKHQVESLTDLDALEFCAGDAVGAIAVCDDIGQKMAFSPASSEQLLDLIGALPTSQSNAHIVSLLHDMHGTSLGGERPKITVLHEGQQWIAKFASQSDDPQATLREYLAMKIAALCEIDVAPVQYVNCNGRGLLLVQRFDRHYDETGRLMRKQFASAATVIGHAPTVRGNRGRTYPNLAMQALRWHVKGHKPQLWRRMAYNVLIGNGDDHLRNHGFLLESEGWRLSPAFDIAPYATRNGNAVEVKSLSLGILPNGDAAATVENLLFVSKFFDVSYEEAVNYLERASATIRKEWNALAKQVSQVPIGQPNFQLPSFGQWPTQSNVHKYRSY